MEKGERTTTDPVHTTKLRAGKRRTYFFDVRETKGGDYFITLTESTRRFMGDGYDRHKLFLYKEDFNRFVKTLNEFVDYVKTELMPDFDFEEYDRRQEEWERKRAEENNDDFSSVKSNNEEDMDW
ncbi:MAG: DUF3276 family protein [Saprospiraceae bacterium]